MHVGKNSWKLFGSGKGIPISIFDIPNDPEEEEVPPEPSKVSPYVSNGIAIAVTVIWSLSFLADIFISGYAPPTAIHVAFMGIVGAIFGFQIFNGGRDK